MFFGIDRMDRGAKARPAIAPDIFRSWRRFITFILLLCLVKVISNTTGKQGTFGGYQSWANRAGRYRSLGNGQVDFKRIFSKLTQYDFKGWAVMEWECCIKDSETGAREGAAFIRNHIIPVTTKAFDDFATSGGNQDFNKKILGI